MVGVKVISRELEEAVSKRSEQLSKSEDFLVSRVSIYSMNAATGEEEEVKAGRMRIKVVLSFLLSELKTFLSGP